LIRGLLGTNRNTVHDEKGEGGGEDRRQLV
jgi:hypothetical protein